MAIPKKGSRKITVDGTDYRWTIRRKPSYGQAIEESMLTAAIELFENPGSLLLVTFPFPRPDSWVSNDGRAVTPTAIERSIKKSIEAGWKPAQCSPNFNLDASKD